MTQLAQEIREKLHECMPGYGTDRIARAVELGYFLVRIAPDVLQVLDAESKLKEASPAVRSAVKAARHMRDKRSLPEAYEDLLKAVEAAYQLD